MKNLYSVSDVAQILGVSIPTVNRWLNNGALKGFRPVRKASWKVSRTELVRHMGQHEVPLELLDRGTTRILIVDDEPKVARIIMLSLSNLPDVQLEIAHTGFTAGAKLESFRPDIVILDIFLEDMDGRELVDHIRSHPELSATKVVGVSGILTEAEGANLMKLGFAAFIGKPFIGNELSDRVALLAGRGLETARGTS